MNLKRQAKFGLNLNAHRVVFFLDDYTNKVLKQNQMNLTNSQYLVLKCIFLLDSPSQKAIADYIGTSPAAISRHCKSLKEKNLIDIESLSSREYKLRLTSEGKEKFEKALEILHKKLDETLPVHNKLAKLLMEFLEKDAN